MCSIIAPGLGCGLIAECALVDYIVLPVLNWFCINSMDSS